MRSEAPRPPPIIPGIHYSTTTFNNVPKNVDGVQEDAVDDYESRVVQQSATKDGTVLLACNYYETTELTIRGQKVWNDQGNQGNQRRDSITVWLLSDGTRIASQEVSEATDWKFAIRARKH